MIHIGVSIAINPLVFHRYLIEDAEVLQNINVICLLLQITFIRHDRILQDLVAKIVKWTNVKNSCYEGLPTWLMYQLIDNVQLIDKILLTELMLKALKYS